MTLSLRLLSTVEDLEIRSLFHHKSKEEKEQEQEKKEQEQDHLVHIGHTGAVVDEGPVNGFTEKTGNSDDWDI
jgi:hypothetical protein